MNADQIRDRFAKNLADVHQRIADAAARSGRQSEEILLVAVSKYVGLEIIEPLIEAGATVLGESRPQQFWPKAEALAGRSIQWHMIGQLQRNKIRRTLPLVELTHSADSLRLVEAVDRIAGELSLRAPILLEVNTSGDAAKHGFSPHELEQSLNELAGFPNVEIRGLMCMAGLGTDAGRRGDFAALRELRDKLRKICPDSVKLNELSMGMSQDYELAIEEGGDDRSSGKCPLRGHSAVIDLEQRETGVVLPVKAHAGARRNEIRGVQNGMLRVSVTQAPEKGKANKAIVALLAKQLSLRKAQIELISGETSTQKRFLVSGTSLAELRKCIAQLIQE